MWTFPKAKFALLHPRIAYDNTLLEGPTIFDIVHMTWNPCPIFHTFYTIKYDPRGLRITSNLHTLQKFHSTTKAIHKHFESKYFVLRLTWEMVSMEKFEPLLVFEHHIIVHGTNLSSYKSLWSRIQNYKIKPNPSCPSQPLGKLPIDDGAHLVLEISWVLPRLFVWCHHNTTIFMQ